MAQRQSVTFLTVIWGQRYIEEFATISLPSYLAPGNLPLLAAETDMEVLILSTENSVGHFKSQPAFQRLKSLVPVRFIYIDDLITSGIYGVTLTLAYARGIQSKGDAQTKTYFVFMNSDFVLADGAGTALLREMRSGRRVIMAATLRASAEKVVPVLQDAVCKESHALVMPPREMVRLTLDNLHPTVIAKTVTQNLITCASHNQMYWQVNNSTLLARHYLIFMLTIKPEQPLGAITSYCDYGFVPDLVPSGDIKVIDDSDDLFMLELQPESQEVEQLISGGKSLAAIASELSSWTTKEHRLCAETAVMFRTGEPPAALSEAKQKFAAYICGLQRHLSETAVSHTYHRYWVLGVQAWLKRRASSEGLADNTTLRLPPELSSAFYPETWTPRGETATSKSACLGAQRRYNELVGRLVATAQKAQGVFPDVPIWHHDWADAQLVKGWIRSRQGYRNLLIHFPASSIPLYVNRNRQGEPRFQTLQIEPVDTPELIVASIRERFPEPFDHVIVHIYLKNVRQTAQILQAALACLNPGGSIGVFIEHTNSDLDPSDFRSELVQYIGDILPSGWIAYGIEAAFTGGHTKRGLARLQRAFRRRVLPPFLSKVPISMIAIAGWCVNSGLIAVNNLRSARSGPDCPAYCSSAMVTVRPREA